MNQIRGCVSVCWRDRGRPFSSPLARECFSCWTRLGLVWSRPACRVLRGSESVRLLLDGEMGHPSPTWRQPRCCCDRFRPVPPAAPSRGSPSPNPSRDRPQQQDAAENQKRVGGTTLPPHGTTRLARPRVGGVSPELWPQMGTGGSKNIIGICGILRNMYWQICAHHHSATY